MVYRLVQGSVAWLGSDATDVVRIRRKKHLKQDDLFLSGRAHGYPGNVPKEPNPHALRHVSFGHFFGLSGISSCHGRGAQ